MSDQESDDFGQRFASLEAASRNLSLDVQSLDETLKIVNALQVEQKAQRERQDQADLNLAIAKDAADQRDMRTRRISVGVALALAIVLPIVSILIYGALIHHVSNLLTTQKAGFYASCMTRNQATLDNIKRERLLAEAETNPKVRKIHLDSAASLGRGLPNCNAYLK